MSLAIKLTDVHVHFALAGGAARHDALRGLDLEVSKGERLGLVGRNGAGKSTLLRIMAGIYPPAAGTVWRAPELSIALLSLGLGFKPELTGRENALLAAILQGMPKSQAKTQLDVIGDFTELGKFYDEPVKTYSSGMRSRLGFATGLLLDTDILLLDEILSVGDRAFRQKASEALINKLASDRTVILVNHAERPIRNICTRAVWLERGEIKTSGDVDAVLTAYQSGA
jgi:lipopolysaccharide transport system ATP-binding protein